MAQFLDSIEQHLLEELNAPYALTPTQIDFYRENGFIKLKNVLSPQVLAFYGQEFTRQVLELNTLELPMEQRTTYQKAFLQVENLWQYSPRIKYFVMSKRLGRIATELMGVSGVRLYHDQALYKEGNGGFTPWHADQYYWPLSNNHTTTIWIPLQETPLDMGPLSFALKSQQLEIGRDLAISDESEAVLQKTLTDAGIQEMETAYDLGEVSFHSGWTFHRAGPNFTGRTREVMTIIYMDEAIRLASPTNHNQVADWNRWLLGAAIGEAINTPLNPIIYSGR